MEVSIGKVTHYYTHLGVAVLELEEPLKTGDTVLILGHTTDLTQPVTSLEADHHKIQTARPGQQAALKVDEPVRRGDIVFRVVESSPDASNTLLWGLMHAAWEAILPSYQAVFDRFIDDSGLDGKTTGLLLAALTFEPQAATVARLQVRGPYTSAAAYRTRLANAAEKGYFFEVVPGEYALTSFGRSEIERLLAQSRARMAAADPLSPEDGDCLAGLLDRLVQASLYSPPPPGNWSIQLAYQIMPPLQPPLPFTEQAFSCLSAYRDDAHLGAWQPGGLTAPAFEALTLFWRGEASSIETVSQRLAQRGHMEQTYAHALAELRSFGYIEGPDRAACLTPAGRAYRAGVEALTGRYFYAPWTCLEESDRLVLHRLLTALRDGLRS